MATKLKWGGGGKGLVAGPLKKDFFAASFTDLIDRYLQRMNITYINNIVRANKALPMRKNTFLKLYLSYLKTKKILLPLSSKGGGR